uniref:Aldo/keto reductase family, putative n=1 Tax=Theileria annulata TaxID=5874 RepID=A0A3B0MUH4_THEAN
MILLIIILIILRIFSYKLKFNNNLLFNNKFIKFDNKLLFDIKLSTDKDIKLSPDGIKLSIENNIKVNLDNNKKNLNELRNKNILKNLGKSNINSILYNIQQYINNKIYSNDSITKCVKDSTTMGKGANDTFSTMGKGANDTFSTPGKGANFTAMECTTKDTKGVGEGIGAVGASTVMEKKTILYNNLKLINNKNNFKSEKILKTNDFIDGMLYRRLGETDMLISQLCIGTSMYDNPELIDPEHSIDIMETAFKRFGINFYDICEYDPYPYEPKSYKLHHKTIKEFIKRVGHNNIILSARISSNNLGKYKSSGRYLSWVRNDIHEPPNIKVIEKVVDNLLLNLNIDYLDILSFVYPYRYIPLSHLGEDTYCWSHEFTHTNTKSSSTISSHQSTNTTPQSTQSTESTESNGLKAFDMNNIPNCNECIVGLDNLDEQIEILNELYLKGKIKSVGLSNETVWGIYRMKTHPNRKFKLSCIQTLYNLLHRNELESNGIVEASLKENFNCPIIAYGTLAGGILTGKYLDPERINPLDEFPEDYGHLSYGPSNSRCNLFPQTYHTHRTVWCQHVTGEYMKLARTYGLTLSQLAHSYTFSRPFICSSIIGPRSIGQLYETISSLNYPVTKELEDDIHEIFLRYRAVTMGGPQFLTKIDEFEVPVSQNDIMKNGLLPIWSGGSHWSMDHIPSFDKLFYLHNKKDELIHIKRIFGLLDKPNDSNWANYRCWIERTNEHLPGEYFALKESKLFCWDTMKIENITLINKTEEEIKSDDTSDFHFYWKSGKIFVGPTTEAIYNFYNDKEAQYNIIKQREESIKKAMNIKQFDEDMKIWSPIDVDLVYKRLMERHLINPLNVYELEELLYDFMIQGKELTNEEKNCEKFAYFNKQINYLNTSNQLYSLD